MNEVFEEGYIVKYFRDKGFGFIKSEKSPEGVFFHSSIVKGKNLTRLFDEINEKAMLNGDVFPAIKVSFKSLLTTDQKKRAYKIQSLDENTIIADLEEKFSSTSKDKNLQNFLTFVTSSISQNELFTNFKLYESLRKYFPENGNYDNLFNFLSIWGSLIRNFSKDNYYRWSEEDLGLISDFIQLLFQYIPFQPQDQYQYLPKYSAILQTLKIPHSPIKCFREIEVFSLVIIPNTKLLESLFHDEQFLISDNNKQLNIYIILDNRYSIEEIQKNYNLLVLDRMAILELFFSSDQDYKIAIGKFFRRMLKDNPIVLESIIQPFSTSTTYQDCLFFGRESYISTILDDRTSNYAIYGGRRIGKTWLCAKFNDVCTNGINYREIYYPLLVSLQSVTNIESAVNLVCEKIEYETKVTSSAKDPLAKLGNSLLKLKKSQNKTILLEIDEIDKFLRNKDNIIFFERLRQLQSTYPSSFKYIFSGFKDLIHIFCENAIDNPFFHWLGNNHFPLGLLSEKELELMIHNIKWAGIDFDESEIKDKIFDITAGHPYYTQDLCSRIVKTCIRNNSYNLVNQHIDKLATEEFLVDIFADFESNLSDLQRLIGKIFANNGKSYQEKDIIYELKTRYAIDITNKELKEEMDVLLACSIFSKSITGYHPVIQWINKKYFDQFEDEELVLTYWSKTND